MLPLASHNMSPQAALHQHVSAAAQNPLEARVSFIYETLQREHCTEDRRMVKPFNAIEINENLVVDGIPPLSDEIIEKTAKYTDFRPTYLFSLHPHSKEMLVGTRPQGGQTLQLHSVATPSGPAKKLFNWNDRVLGATYEPVKGQYAVFISDKNGNEKYQFYYYDFVNEPVLITDGQSRNNFGAWSFNGSTLAYTSSKRNGKDQDLYIIDPANPGSSHLVKEFSQGDSWGVMGWSADDTKLLMIEYLSPLQSHLWTVNIADGAMTRITEKVEGKEVSYADASYSSDGKSLYYVTDKDTEFSRLVRVDLTTGQTHNITEGLLGGIESFKINPANPHKILYLSNEKGLSVLHLVTLCGDKFDDKAVPSLPKGVFGGLKWHKSGEYFNFTINSAQTCTDVFSIDLETLTLKRCTETKSLIDTSKFVEPELVTWKSFDGMEISGFLYTPKHTNGKVPVYVHVHGGPESQFRPTFLGQLNYYIEEMNVALLFPNIRGSSGHGKTFLSAADGFKRQDAYEDINALLKSIKEHPKLDGDRILVGGGSYGGHVALVVASKYSDKIKCSLSSVGISNIVSFFREYRT